MIRRCTASTLVLAAAAATATAAGLGPLAPAVSQAQEPQPNVPVQERPRPAFDPLGIRLGNFLVFPRLTVSETYNSNVFADPDDEEDDLITVIEPTVSVQSNFPRHALGLNAGANIGFYLDQNDENYQDYFGQVTGRLDVTRAGAFFGDLRAAREHEPRESPDAPDAAEEPTEINVFSGNLGYRHAFNRLNFRVLGGARVLDFKDVDAIDGTVIDQDDRDRALYDARLRVGYLMSPRINLFTEGRYTITDFDETPDGDFDRDSQGYEIRGGAEIDFTAVLFGEVFGGYRFVEFDGDAFDDASGISFGAGLTWNVTELTTVQLFGERDVVPTTAAAGSAGRFSTDVRLEVHHELLRNVLLNGLVAYGRDEFEDVDRTDNIYAAGAGAEYLLNRYLSVELDYRFTTRDSDLETEEFDRHLVTLGLTGRL